MWNEGPAIDAAQWVIFGLATFAIIIRTGACKRPQYGFWWDDFVIIFAWAIFLGTSVTGSIAFAWGTGKYSYDVDPEVLPRATLMGIIATDLGMLADAVPKVGVALLIIRLFNPRAWTKWLMITMTMLGVLFNIILIILSFVQCQPVKYQWNRDTMEGSCWNIDIYTDFAYFTGSWTAALDLAFSVYPLFVISQLNMQWRKKLAVMATMSFGFGTFAVTVYKVATQYPKFRHAAYDATRVLADIMLWNALGAGFTIIAGSIPAWGWVFHTRSWKLFVHWVSGGAISASSSRATSTIAEKTLSAASTRSWRTTPDGSARPSQEDLPVPPELPLTFPQRAHYSGRSSGTRTPATSYSGGSSRSQSRVPSRTVSRVPSRVESLGRGRTQAHHTIPEHRASSPVRIHSAPLPMDSILQLERSTYMN